MFPGVAHELGGGVETHRLAVEQGAAESGGVVAFDPRAGVDEQGETGGVRFGETIFAKALDLIEAPLGEIGVIAVAQHSRDEFVMKFVDGA